MIFLKEKLVFIIIMVIMLLLVLGFGCDKVFDKGILSNIFSELIGILFTSVVIVWHINKFGQPKIRISDTIAQSYNTVTEKNEYRIKVINETKYDLINIQNTF